MTVGFRIEPFGDSAFAVRLDAPVGLETSRRVQAIAGILDRASRGRAGWGRAIPGATSVLVGVDPIDPGVEAAARTVEDLLADPAALAEALDQAAEQARTIEIPVTYGGSAGPDLAAVADSVGLEPSQVVELHAATSWHALFLGFAPGFAYLGVAPPELTVPRRPQPRVRVPAGSVALAGPFSAIYPAESPGGWQILGRTSAVLWDARRDPPNPVRAGDVVRFVAER